MVDEPYSKFTSIHRHFELDAGHRLSEHNFKCQNLHGHRYVYDITIGGTPDPDLGYVVDFSNVKGPVMDAFDHNFIFNEGDPVADLVSDGVVEHQEKEPYLLPVEPTVENIAVESLKLMWESFTEKEQRNIHEVTIALNETPNCEVTRVFTSEPGDTEWVVSK